MVCTLKHCQKKKQTIKIGLPPERHKEISIKKGPKTSTNTSPKKTDIYQRRIWRGSTLHITNECEIK